MNVFETKNDTHFMFNSIEYPKTFLATTDGNGKISVNSIGNDKSQLLPPTHYSFISVNDIIMSSEGLAIEKLNELIYSQPSGAAGEPMPNPDDFVLKTDTVTWQKHRFTEDNGNAIHLVSTDANTYEKSGFYAGSFNTNVPITGSAYLEVMCSDSNNMIQKLTPGSSGVPLSFYERRKVGGTWLSWQKFEKIDNATAIPTLLSDFLEYGAGYEQLRVYRKGDICYIEGMVKYEWKEGETILPLRTQVLQLPEGFRPTKVIMLTAVARNNTYPWRVLPSGIVDCNTQIHKVSESDWFSLSMSYVLR